MKGFIVEMFRGVKGEISSKRVITFVAFLCVVLAFLVNVFMEVPLEEHIFDGMLYLVMSGMGLSAFEKFSPKHAHSDMPKEQDDDFILTDDMKQ